MIIYQIRLPKQQDAKAFVTFMREEYFPAVHKGPLRAGQVTALMLLERQNEVEGDDVGNEFVWHVGWEGPGMVKVDIDDGAVARKFDSFTASLTYIGSYVEVATWPKDDAA